VEPRVESVRVSQAWEVAPRSDEGLLGGVIGGIGVAEDQAGGPHETRQRALGKDAERVLVSMHRALHQLSAQLTFPTLR
jgi:hypothetical protein